MSTPTARAVLIGVPIGVVPAFSPVSAQVQTANSADARLTYEMWRACRLVIDTGIHPFGRTREQAMAYLRDRAPLSEHEITTEIERDIAWPGQALAYKLGELQIRRHRREAEEKLGARFDQRRFHDAILAIGSVPLPALEQRMTQFIADERAVR